MKLTNFAHGNIMLGKTSADCFGGKLMVERAKHLYRFPSPVPYYSPTFFFLLAGSFFIIFAETGNTREFRGHSTNGSLVLVFKLYAIMCIEIM